MKAPHFSRRSLIALGAASAGGIAVAAIIAVKGSPGSISVDIVKHALRGVQLDPAGLELFRANEERLNQSQFVASVKRRAFVPLRAYVHAAPMATPASIARKVEELERHTLSRFLHGSDFFYIDPSIDVVTYTGDVIGTCPNPFLRPLDA